MVALKTFPRPIFDNTEEKLPLAIAEAAVLLISVKLSFVALDGVTTAVTVVEPLKTPTTLTRDVSTMLRRAHRLLMKLVIVLLLLKKLLISVEKWVVSWTDSVISTVMRQSMAEVTTNAIVLFV